MSNNMKVIHEDADFICFFVYWFEMSDTQKSRKYEYLSIYRKNADTDNGRYNDAIINILTPATKKIFNGCEHCERKVFEYSGDSNIQNEEQFIEKHTEIVKMFCSLSEKDRENVLLNNPQLKSLEDFEKGIKAVIAAIET